MAKSSNGYISLLENVAEWPLFVYDDVRTAMKSGIALKALLPAGAAVGLFFALSQNAMQAGDYVLPYLVAGGAYHVLSPSTSAPVVLKPPKGGK